MRPRSRMVLARNDVDLSLWSMRLDVAARYGVPAATTLEEASMQLATHADGPLFLTQWAAEPVMGALHREGQGLLFFNCDRVKAEPGAADATVAGPALRARELEEGGGLLASRRRSKPKIEFEATA